MGCAPSWSGKIVYLEDGKLVIQPENKEEIKSGQKLLVHRQKTITHPVTGEELGMIKDNIAEVSVTWVRNKTVTALAADPWFDMMMVDDRVSAVRGSVKPMAGSVLEIGKIQDFDTGYKVIRVAAMTDKPLLREDKMAVVKYTNTIADPETGEILAVKVESLANLIEMRNNTVFSYELTDNLNWIENDDFIVKRTGDMLKESQWFQDPPDGFSDTWIFRRNYLRAIYSYYYLGLYKEAMLELNNVNPQYEDTGYLIGLCYTKINRYDEAVKYLNNYLKQNQEDVRVWTLLAYTYLKQGNLLDSAKAYEKLTALMPNEPKIFVDLGDVYQKIGDQQKAEKAYKKALEIDPNNEEAKYELQQK
jgi:DNA-directed RNA polymerase subunit F